jgi:hypothetical protein
MAALRAGTRPNHGLGGPQGFTTLDYLLGNAVSSDHLKRVPSGCIEHGANPDTSNAYSRQPPCWWRRSFMASLTWPICSSGYGATPVPLSGASAFIAAAMRVMPLRRASSPQDTRALRPHMALIMAAQRRL